MDILLNYNYSAVTLLFHKSTVVENSRALGHSSIKAVVIVYSDSNKAMISEPIHMYSHFHL